VPAVVVVDRVSLAVDTVNGDLLIIVTQKHESFVARSAIILNSDGVVAVIRDRLRGVG